MKKIIAALLTTALAISALTACGSQAESTDAPAAEAPAEEAAPAEETPAEEAPAAEAAGGGEFNKIYAIYKAGDQTCIAAHIPHFYPGIRLGYIIYILPFFAL